MAFDVCSMGTRARERSRLAEVQEIAAPRIIAMGGPVSAAIRAMRADEPATDYARIRELRRAIADRIEADIALLDALTPDADFEPSLCGLSVEEPAVGAYDAEGPDDNGVADSDGEQWVRGATRSAAEHEAVIAAGGL